MTECWLDKVAAQGQSVCRSTCSRRSSSDRAKLSRMLGEDAVTGLTSNPSIFQKGDLRRHDYDDQIREMPGEDRQPRGRSSPPSPSPASGRDATSSGQSGSGRTVPTFVSLEVDPRSPERRRPHYEQAIKLRVKSGSTERLHQDPRHGRGDTAMRTGPQMGSTIHLSISSRSESATATSPRPTSGASRACRPRSGGLSKVHSDPPRSSVSRLGRRRTRDSRSSRTLGLQRKARIREREARQQGVRGGSSTGAVWDRLLAAANSEQHGRSGPSTTKNPAYRDTMYVEELIGPDTSTRCRSRPSSASRITARCAATRSTTGSRRPSSSTSSRPDVDYDDLVVLETEGVKKFADAFDELIAGIEARRGGGGRRPSGASSTSPGSGHSRDPTVWTRKDRRAVALAARRARPDLPGAVGSLLRLAEDVVGDERGRPPRDGRIVARTRGAAHPIRRGGLPRARHDPSGGDEPLEAKLDLDRTLFISASKSGSTLETRSHTDYFWKRVPRERAVGRDHRPRLDARGARRRAELRGGGPRRADDRRHFSALSPFRLFQQRDGGRRGLDRAGRVAMPAASAWANRPRSSGWRSARAGARAATRSACRTRARSGSGSSNSSRSRPARRKGTRARPGRVR